MWEHIFESSKREQHRIYSSFNLAVLLETQHRLEEALVWLNKCDEINPEKVVIRDFDIQQYKNLLTERIRQKELLRQQGVIE